MPVVCADRNTMGFDFGLQRSAFCVSKRKDRWLLKIEGICADDGSTGTANVLPPLKSSRPQLEFKEQQVAHLTQSVYYPILPEWKPIPLTLYDIKKNKNVVFEWIKGIYNPKGGDKDNPEWKPVYDKQANVPFKRNAVLCMYDGTGKVCESWTLESCYPTTVSFGELDMNSSEIMIIELTLRYDRAYINE